MSRTIVMLMMVLVPAVACAQDAGFTNILPGGAPSCGEAKQVYTDELVTLCHPSQWPGGTAVNPRPGTRRYTVFVAKGPGGNEIGTLEVIHLDMAAFPRERSTELSRHPERTLIDWVAGALLPQDKRGRFAPATPQLATLAGETAGELALRDLSNAGVKDVLTITAARIGETAVVVVEAINRYNLRDAASMAFARDLAATKSSLRLKAAWQADAPAATRPSREPAASPSARCQAGPAPDPDFILGEWRASIGGTAFSAISRLDETGTIEVGLRFHGNGTYDSGVMYRGFGPDGSWRAASSGRYELCASGDRNRPWLLVLTPREFDVNSKTGESLLRSLSLPHGEPMRLKVKPIADFIHYLDFDGEQGDAWSAHRSSSAAR